MTRDDITRMARDSGMELYGLGKDREKFLYHLERFFNMAQAAEREACAKVADEWTHAYPHPSKVIADTIRARGQA